MTAYKNSGNDTESRWRNQAIFFTVLLMLISLFISRGALSIAIILFPGIAILHKDFFKQLRNLFIHPFLLSLTFLFLIPFISGLWSADIKQWANVVRIKLPLLFIPFAFAGNWKLTQKQWLFISLFFLTCIAAGCAWGLIEYALNSTAIHESYLKAKTIATPLEDDHVRFSWLVSVAIILCLFLIEMVQLKAVKFFAILLLLFFAIYLHILSARTGLISLYIFLFIYSVRLLLKLKKPVLASGLFLLLLALPFIAYQLLPTFKNRIQYIQYDLSFAQKQQYLPGSSDGARTMSLKAGWHILKNNPVGVGAGDVMKEADKWYAANVPQALPSDKFYPSSEWLMYGAFAGWPGAVLFTVVMLMPFIIKIAEYKFFWIAFHLIAAFSFAFDMGLEVQYGVFLYAFIGCWWWKWLVSSGSRLQTITIVNRIF